MPNMKYKEFLTKVASEDIINKMEEDAPANAVGTGANVALPPTHEPGVKKKKKKDVVMGTMKRKMMEGDDNNNIVLKGVIETLNKFEDIIDRKNGIEKEEIKIVEKKEYKSFRDKYNA
jgi:hypothetical protein